MLHQPPATDAGAEPHADELQESAAIERGAVERFVVVEVTGASRVEMSGSSTAVSYARCISGSMSTRFTIVSHSYHCVERAKSYSTCREVAGGSRTASA